MTLSGRDSLLAFFLVYLVAPPALAADKPTARAPKAVAVAESTIAEWLHMLEQRSLEDVRKDLGKPMSQREWKHLGKAHPKHVYQLPSRGQLTLMLYEGKVYAAFAIFNMSNDSEKPTLKLPNNLAQAARTLTEWGAAFDGKTETQVRNVLGTPTRTTDWAFRGRTYPVMEYQCTGKNKLGLYFLKDRVILTMVTIHSPGCR